MSASELVCDQAIFTSVRSPMGEGYRIVAASRGLKADEKQHITKYSPSHEALCPTPGASEQEGRPLAVSFYTLPTGRLCVACACYAGAEHTGRGGQRVYTVNVVFSADAFAACGFNPFAVVRGMSAAGMLVPQLKLPALLDEVRLVLDESAFQGGNKPGRDAQEDARRRTAPMGVLERLLENRSTVLNTASDPLVMAEWILAGVPGPMRSTMPFSAGVRFSVGRTHRLQVVFDEKHACRDKVRGKQIEYVDALAVSGVASRAEGTPSVRHAPPTSQVAATEQHPKAPTASAWLSLVERCWSADDLSRLLARTSKAYPDTTPPARERIGRLYRDVDSVSNLAPVAILDLLEPHLANDRNGPEAAIVDELLNRSREAISGQLSALTVDQLRTTLRRLSVIGVRGARGATLAGQPIRDALRTFVRQDVSGALEALIELRSSPAWVRVWGDTASASSSELVALFADAVERFARMQLAATDVDSNDTPADTRRVKALVQRFVLAFPDEPAVKRCSEEFDRLARSSTPATVV